MVVAPMVGGLKRQMQPRAKGSGEREGDLTCSFLGFMQGDKRLKV